MSTVQSSHHLDGDESVRLSTDADNHVALYIYDPRGSSSLGVVLPDYNGAAVNAALLRELASQAEHLARVVEYREAERAARLSGGAA